MHVIVWEFVVEAEKAEQFVAAYGPNGAWAQLFFKADGYLGTDLLAASDLANRYITFDRWRSEAHFSKFLAEFRDAYQELDQTCESLTIRQKKIGGFSASDPFPL